MSSEDACPCCGTLKSNTVPPPVKLDVREMLRSGQAVNSAVTPSILAGISALETEIKDLGRDISRLGALINQKKSRIASTKTTLLEYRSAMAPIRTLPPEVLLHIFTLANEDGVLFVNSPRMRIGHVCKAWRSLSRASPSLWNDIIFGNFWRHTFAGWVPKYLEQSLVLSCPRPLHISIYLPSAQYLPSEHNPHHPVQNHITQVAHLLCGHTSRWKTLFFSGPEFAISTLFELLSGFLFESLESLTIHCTENESSFAEPTQKFSLGPRLRTLKLNFESSNYMVIQWSTLTSFSGAFMSNSACYAFLVAASKLETLSLIHIDHHDDVNASTPSQILPNIRHLVLYSCAITNILGLLTMPNLQHLELEHRRYEVPEHPSPCRMQLDAQFHVADLLSRSGCPLSSITISGPIVPTEFIPRLSPTLRSSVKTFKVTLEYESSSLTSALLDSLTTTQDGHFFSNLVELQIIERMDDMAVFCNPRLKPAILSRWDVPPGVARLQRLTLSGEYLSVVEHPHHSSSLSICLQELSEKGLDVRWTIDQEDILDLGREYFRSIH